ncbi:sensor histidine kinase [Pedobacter sp. AW31-3R]|uniref:sensor histidine kinase n=1 Tax=Pedobacter sp. AW31-3R TaxID=3445781 RepID=UPI003FA1661C
MFQNYQLKWCFILIGILVATTTLMRKWDVEILSVQHAGRIISITLFVLISWLIMGYFKMNRIQGLSTDANTMASVFVASVAILGLNYFIIFYVPASMYINDAPYEPTFFDFLRRYVGSFLLTMISFIVFNTISTKDILQQTRIENEQFKQAHLRAQLLSLQQQISPHFLFNSLSTLKTITEEADTKHFVIQLSHVYRYLLNINEHQTTNLSEELKFIHAYLYILHVRFEGALHVSIEIPDDFHNYLIPPLSLQLLIENAIKHNVVSMENPLNISVFLNGNNELVVQNPYHPKKVAVESTYLGLQNINDRFRLLFNKEIAISRTEEFFTVTLPIISNESHYH